jgi:hypothetical protein
MESKLKNMGYSGRLTRLSVPGMFIMKRGARLRVAKSKIRQAIIKMVIANSFVIPRSIGVMPFLRLSREDDYRSDCRWN